MVDQRHQTLGAVPWLPNKLLHATALRIAAREQWRWAALMRIWPILTFLAMSSMTIAGAAIRSSSPEERPTGIQAESGELIIELDRGSIAHFTLEAKTVSHILVRVGDRRLSADLRTCVLPRSIHSDGMKLIRDDLREDEYRTDALTLLFDAGSDSDRAFGRFPRVQLTWVDGELAAALISRQIATNHGFSSPLCSPDVQPNKRFERAPASNAPLLGLSSGAAQAQSSAS